MRKKIIAGNWKMNLNFAESMALVDSILGGADEQLPCEIVLAPPFVFLRDVLTRIQRASNISLAAQNCSEHVKGAYTGEVSAAMLASMGVDFVLVGHSERRSFFHETNQQLAGKISRNLENSLVPIYCCGESLNERNAGSHFDTVRKQLEEGLFHLSDDSFRNCVIAYEPVWAIGTGVTATPAQAQEMHAFIRKEMEKKYGSDTAENIPILYGGSVHAKNARELFSCGDVDGALVGGASLKAEEFISIIRAAV